MAILRRFTPLVEPISIDEAFLDVTGSAALFGDGPAIARRIKDEVRDEVGLTASVGVATTKLVAKIASDLRKPDGLVVVPAGEEAAFLAPLPIGAAVGRRREDRRVALAEYGVRTIGDLAGAAAGPPRPPVRQARRVAGRPRARDRCRPGPRRRPGQVGRPRAHVRRRHQRPARSSSGRCSRWPTASPGGCARRASRAGTVAVKIRDSGVPDDHPPADAGRADRPDRADLSRAALELARPEIRGIRVRLLGVTASNLGEREQLALFERDDPRHRRAVEAADALRRRYGERAVTRARLLGAGLPAPFERDPRNPLDRRARGVADRRRTRPTERAPPRP